MRLFLSYSRMDELAAGRLYSELSAAGLSVWFDKESLLAGQRWETEIRKAIRNSDLVLVLLSTQTVSRRGYFQKELRLALDILDEIPSGDLYLVPVRLDDCEVPHDVSSVQCVDLFPDWRGGIQKLLKSLRYQAKKLQDDDTGIDGLLQRLDAMVQSPLQEVDLHELTRMLLQPTGPRERVDALAEIGIRGFGDARTFFALEQEALADSGSLPPGQGRDDANYIRQAALWTIGALNRPERTEGVPTSRMIGLDAIKTVLEGEAENAEVKSAAVQALMVINRPQDPMFISMLHRVRNDRSPHVRQLVEDALAGKVIQL